MHDQETRNPAGNGGARLEAFDLLGADQHHQDSEPRATLQERRIARLFFVAPETAATIARLAYGVAP
jgi:hypothetical protein